MKSKQKLVYKFNLLTIRYDFAIIDILAKYFNISTSYAVALWQLLQLIYFGYKISRIKVNDLVIIGNWLKILAGY